MRGRPYKSLLSEFDGSTMTVELARLLWSYDQESGQFVWMVTAHPTKCKSGDEAGTIGTLGYRVLTFKGVKYKASRIAWLIVTGAWPRHEVDHKDCDPANDRWSNLREATSSQNKCNTRTRKDNALGLKGVSPTQSQTFAAFICLNGKRKNLGSFATAVEAKVAYDAAAQCLHGEFRRTL